MVLLRTRLPIYFKSASFIKSFYNCVLAILSVSCFLALFLTAHTGIWKNSGLILAVSVIYIITEHYNVIIKIPGWTASDLEPHEPRTLYVGLSEAPLIFAIVVLGTQGIFPILVAVLLTTRFVRHRSWLNVFFNVAYRTIDYCLLEAFYSQTHLAGQLPFHGIVGALSLIVLLLVWPLWDVLSFSLLIAIRSGRAYIEEIQQGVAFTAWIGIIPLCMGAVCAIVWSLDPWLIIPVIIPMLLAHRALQAVAQYFEEHTKVVSLVYALKSREVELQTLNAELEDRVAERTQQITDLLNLRMTETSAAVHDLRHHVEAVETTSDALLMVVAQTAASQPLFSEGQRRLKSTFVALKTMLGEMLDAALMEHGQLIMHPVPVDLPLLVSRVGQQLAARYNLLQCQLVVQTPPSLPVVYCDPMRIERVVYNLLHNAAIYTSDYAEHHAEQGTTPQVNVTFDRLPNQLIACHIRDTGPGITSADIQRLGAIGTRLAADVTRIEGSGMGLHFCFRVLTLNGGSLTIASDGLGTGSTFTMQLPRAEDDACGG